MYFFATSSIIVAAFIVLFYCVGLAYKTVIRWLLNYSYEGNFFKDFFYGLIVFVYFFVLVKSRFSLNSITITFAPLFLYLVENKEATATSKPGFSPTGVLKNVKETLSSFLKARSKIYYTLNSLFVIILFLCFNFYFHFHNGQVNTGYGDQGWYHTVAKSLQTTSIETINIHIPSGYLQQGYIYHYWDLWTLCFFYDFLRVLNEIGLLQDFNEFEIYVLVFQPILTIGLFFGMNELAVKITAALSSKIDVTSYFWILPFFSAIALTHGFAEIGIVHHPKQFIIAGLFITIATQLFGKEEKYVKLLFLSPLLLFYFPLPGAVMISTVILFISLNNWHRKILKCRWFWQMILSQVILLGMFVYLYFIHGNTCYTNLNKIYESDSYKISTVFYRLFIYHAYHIAFSFGGVIFFVNAAFLIYLNFPLNYFDNTYSSTIKPVILLLAFAILNFVLGHIISSVFYTAPEEFQFYNNDFFIFSVMTLIDLIAVFVILLQKNNSSVKLLYSLITFILVVVLLKNIYFSNLRYYCAVGIKQDSYEDIKNLKASRCLNTTGTSNTPFVVADIVYSFFNNRSYYNFSFCNSLKQDSLKKTVSTKCPTITIYNKKASEVGASPKNKCFYFSVLGDTNTLTVSER
jgi:hypothetical protein